MTITTTTLTRGAAAAAVAAGLIFIGVQINHPRLDAQSVVTTEMVVRDSLKVVMAVLALIGFTGIYLRHARRTGLLGLVGYLMLSLGYLLILSTSVIAAYVLPALARTDRAYVDDVLAVSRGDRASGDIGALGTVIQVQGTCYLAGGVLLGIALYRARVPARWSAVLLAVGGLVTVALSVMPDAFYRLLAVPNGVAAIGLGYSLWLTTRTETPQSEPGLEPGRGPQVTTAALE
jgi:hypothetical protein